MVAEEVISAVGKGMTRAIEFQRTGYEASKEEYHDFVWHFVNIIRKTSNGHSAQRHSVARNPCPSRNSNWG